MKFAKTLQNNDRAFLLAALAVALASLLLVGCTSTVTPKQVRASVASFDGNGATSGVYKATDGTWAITESARARYNGLVATYGNRFTPTLIFDAGLDTLTNGLYQIDNEHLVKFGKMTLWKKNSVL
jgi:hypothetical protein